MSFSLFLTVSYLFKHQLDIWSDEIAKSSLKVVNNYFSSYIILSSVSCKTCQTSQIIIETIPTNVSQVRPLRTVAGKYYGIEGEKGLKTYLLDKEDIFYRSSIVNMNETVNIEGTVGSGEKKIMILWNETEKVIKVEKGEG
jgi:hypothetical protein